MKSNPSTQFSLTTAVAFAAAAALTACGGGDSAPAPPPPAPSAVLSGTAANGSAMANASVSITDSAGHAACQESPVTTSASGNYTCTLKAGEVAPFFVVITDPTGNLNALVSALGTTPPAGATRTVNATPLTTAILAQLASDSRALSVVDAGSLDGAMLQQITTAVLAQLAEVLTSIGAAADYDPFGSPITAATALSPGNAADQLLDVVKVVTDPGSGKLALTTIDNPSPVLLASATSSGSVLPAPAPEVITLSAAAQFVAQRFTACFALTAAQRALAVDTTLPASQGGPAVTSLAIECQDLTAAATTAAGIDFRDNGYSAGQWLYTLLTSDGMTGARFDVPELMAFYPAATTASGRDEAVLNIKYVDAGGNPGNLITVARSIPASSSTAHPTTWWLTGNQQLVDVNLRAIVRRTEQLNPNAPSSTFASAFQSGLQFLVNAKGPGSVTAAGNLAYARVHGPGLPAAGLVYAAPVAAEVGQVGMDVLNQTGSVSGTTTCFNCPNFWLTRTAGISGTAATTLGSNPTSLTWAPTGVDITQVTKGRKYHVELFYGASTTPTWVYDKTLLTDLVPATQAVQLPWNALGPQSTAALDPSNNSLNGVLSSITVDWVRNLAAEQVRSVNVTVDVHGSLSTSTPVPTGATSIVVTPTPPVPALTATSPRALLLHYRTLDNTDKTSLFSYN